MVIIIVIQKLGIKIRLPGRFVTRTVKKKTVSIDFRSTCLFRTVVDRFAVLEISPRWIFRYFPSQFFHLQNIKIPKYVRWFDVTGFADEFAIA